MDDLGLEEERVNIARGGTRSAAFRELNPLGKVPFFKVRDENKK